MWILIVAAVLYLAYKLLPWYTKRLERKNERLRAELEQRKAEQEARRKAQEKAHRLEISGMDLETLRQRADAGDVDCMKELAERYYLAGGGVEEEDKAQAYHYLTRLAEMGDYSDGYFLGRIIDEGIPGVLEPDEAKAAEVYYLGGLAGEDNSKDSFSMLTFRDPATAKYGHAEEAFQWMLELAEKDLDGNVDERIGELFAAQNPVALKDPVTPEHAVRESYNWMVRAAKKGNAQAADILALAFATGDFLRYRNAVVTNMEEARRYASIVWNDSFTQFFYNHGKQIPYSNFFYALAVVNRDDPEKMRLMLETGAANNNPRCIEALRQLDQSEAG